MRWGNGGSSSPCAVQSGARAVFGGEYPKKVPFTLFARAQGLRVEVLPHAEAERMAFRFKEKDERQNWSFSRTGDWSHSGSVTLQ